jgi:adenine phosphoribosyltransferase
MGKNEWISELISSFDDVPIIEKGEYRYFVHPLSDGIPYIEPGMLKRTSEKVSEIISRTGGCDLILTAESMGIPLASAVSIESGIPFSIARKRKYGLQGEVEVTQLTGYSTSDLYLDLPVKGGEMIILDDVLSTGGTLKALDKGVNSTSWKIKGAIILFNKMGEDRFQLSSELEFPVLSILDVDMKESGCSVYPSTEECR